MRRHGVGTHYSGASLSSLAEHWCESYAGETGQVNETR